MSPAATEPPSRSLRLSIGQRLTLFLGLPLVAIILVSAWADYSIARRMAVHAYDQGLVDSTLALAARIAERDGRILVRLDASAIDILRADRADAVYFAILDAGGRLVAGDAGLAPPVPAPEANPAMFDATHNGSRVRGVRYALPTEAGRVTVLFAETTAKREAAARTIFVAMLAPNLAMVVVTLALVLAAVRSGLAPLSRLRNDIELRSARDLRPLSVEAAPPDLLPLMNALNNLFALLDGASKAQGQFVENAAHQLRTPLAALQTQLELAAADSDAESRGARLQRIGEAADRLSRLVNRLLALARSEPAATLQSQMREIDLRALVENAASEFLDAAVARRIDLGFELQDASIEGIVWLVREMLSNLVDNAIAYTPEGGIVTVRTGRLDRRAFLEVEDNGPGIPADQRDRVFDRFFRLPGTSGHGSGLGLAIVREIAEAHRAEVTISTPAPGRGTRITAVFPPPGAR